MSKDYIKLWLKVLRKQEKYFRNVDFYLRLIKQKAREILGDDVKVYLFGSVAEGKHIVGKSDIDVLVVSKNVKMVSGWQADVKTKILLHIGDILAPFEIHLVTPEIFEGWFKKSAGTIREVEG